MIKKFFEKDSVLKIISVLVALLVWLYVIYIEDPEVEITIDDVPVSYKVAELPGKLSLVDYDVKNIDVKITAKRSDVIQFEEDEVEAYLDLSSISEDGEYDNVKINVSTLNKSIEIIDRSEKTSRVQIDEVISRNIPIGIEFVGKTPEGYIISAEPIMFVESTTISGAKTFVNNVKQAFIRIDCSKITQSKTVSSDIYLLDTDEEIIDKDHIAFKQISISDKHASAYITVSETTYADVVITDANENNKYTVSPEKVEIFSKHQTVEKIYTESIRGKKEDKEGNITLKLVIPEGVTIASGETKVKVKIEDD